MYYKYFLSLFFSIIASISFSQIGIDITGNWDYSIPVSDISEAGTDFFGTYTSAANQVTIDVTNSSGGGSGNGNGNGNGNNGNFHWEIHIQKQDIDWHPDLNLYVRRTGSGNGNNNGGSNGFVQSGTAYQLVTSTNQFFFNGRKIRFNIPIQYEVRDVSVLIPAKTYETTIIYTVTEL